MISAISKYMPRWLMAIIATALVLATVVGSSQDSAQAIDPGETDTVYIADGTNFADALMGATIASLNTSPMLGVAGTNGGDVIPDDTADELDRLTNDKASPLDTIYIFGGTSAVSANVATQLEAWATDVERIAGDSRWGTYEAISQMLPSSIDEAAHAEEADHATTADSATEADNADTLDGQDSSDFLGATDKAADSELLDGMDSTEFLGASAKAADSELLDGNDAGFFGLGANTISQHHGGGTTQDGTGVVLATAALTVDDECGDGSTSHRYLAIADGFTQHSSGTPAIPRWSIGLDATSVDIGDESFRALSVESGDTVGNFSVHKFLASVTPGSYSLNLVGDTNSGSVTTFDATLTVLDLGYSCS